jgi:hypothetical protein
MGGRGQGGGAGERVCAHKQEQDNSGSALQFICFYSPRIMSGLEAERKKTEKDGKRREKTQKDAKRRKMSEPTAKSEPKSKNKNKKSKATAKGQKTKKRQKTGKKRGI